MTVFNSFATYADDWMKSLNDNIPMSEINIPGTHDAATGDDFMSSDKPMAELIARTQILNIGAQWAVGIRAFDLRPAVRTDSKGTQSLRIYHAEFATKATMDGVLDLLSDSLKSHPSECAVIIMRHESSPNRDEKPWASLMDSCLRRHAKVLAQYKPGITLGDMRGKVLIISRDDYARYPMGAYARGWCHTERLEEEQQASIVSQSGQERLWVQDFYDTSAKDGIQVKIKAVSAMLNAAQKRKMSTDGNGIWVINHTSGYALTSDKYCIEPVSTTEGYLTNAEHTNKALMEMILQRKASRVGIVMMDFGGIDEYNRHMVMGLTLTKKIIESNQGYRKP